MDEISIKRATLINAIAKYSTVIMTVIFSAVLARILTPEDYGVVAIITVFTAFFAILSDMGLGTAVIQNKDLSEQDISSIFGFSMHIAIILAIIFCFLSIPISIIYNNDVYKPICLILSLAIIFNTLNMVPNALLMKKKKFVLVGKRMIIVNIITGILTIILAKLGLKYYALVFQSVISSGATFLWNYSSTKPKMKFRYDKESIQKVKSYSGFQFAFSIVNYFSRNLDNLLIGKFMGSVALAYYDKGYKLMLYPVGNLTHVITPVLHPILSEYQNDKKYIYTQYMKVVKILSLLGVFVTVYCFFAAEEIILIIFGEQWISAIPSFKFLALSIWAQMITSSTGSIFQSLGNTRLMFISGTCTSIVSVIAIIVGLSFRNITAVAACVALAMNLSFFITYYILIKYGFELKLREFFRNFISDITIFIILSTTLYSISYFNVDNILLSALYKGIICSIAYVVGLLLTKQHKVFKLLLNTKK